MIYYNIFIALFSKYMARIGESNNECFRVFCSLLFLKQLQVSESFDRIISINMNKGKQGGTMCERSFTLCPWDFQKISSISFLYIDREMKTKNSLKKLVQICINKEWKQDPDPVCSDLSATQLQHSEKDDPTHLASLHMLQDLGLVTDRSMSC